MLPWVAWSLAAPTCLPGQVPVDATHCCWPGQAWEGACTGPPTCPTGLVADGSVCRSATRLVGVVDRTSGAAAAGTLPASDADRLLGSAGDTPVPALVRRTFGGVEVGIGEVVLLGALDEAVFVAALADHLGGVAACAGSGPRGGTSVRLVVDPSGHVGRAAVQGEAGDPFGICVAHAAADWVFPAGAGGMVVATVPFRYERIP